MVAFDDVIAGRQSEDVSAVVGDFVLQRADGVASYQLAVVVDDLAMEIDEVVRGDDLLQSTARQVLLARLLGGTPPRWVHLPMVLAPDGTRVAKRHQSQWTGSTISELRAAGHSASEVLGAIGRALGFREIADDVTLDELVSVARVREVAPTSSWTVPAAWIRARRSG
jgi:glutamyl-tRNA synthetase